MRVVGGIIAFVLVCLAAVALFVVARSGRADAQAYAPTLRQGSLVVQGVPRTFDICLPNSAGAGRRYPIVFMLHGGVVGSGTNIAAVTRLCDFTNRDQFIAVFPNAEGPQWNDGRSTTAWFGNDVAFLNALVGHVAESYGGDRERAFVAGISNGGMMALRMLCESTTTFRAYAAVVANMPEELAQRCRPSRPTPVLFILSRDDPAMPYAGGELFHGHLFGNGREMGAGGRVLSGPDTVRFFAGVNGCSDERVTQLPDRGHDGMSVQMHTFQCGRSPVVLYEIQGGGHGWPGSHVERGPLVMRLLGPVSQDIDATAVMIDFFRRQGM
jgi:polyhydroxybutyrate depolymerase